MTTGGGENACRENRPKRSYTGAHRPHLTERIQTDKRIEAIVKKKSNESLQKRGGQKLKGEPHSMLSKKRRWLPRWVRLSKTESLFCTLSCFFFCKQKSSVERRTGNTSAGCKKRIKHWSVGKGGVKEREGKEKNETGATQRKPKKRRREKEGKRGEGLCYRPRAVPQRTQTKQKKEWKKTACTSLLHKQTKQHVNQCRETT